MPRPGAGVKTLYVCLCVCVGGRGGEGVKKLNKTKITAKEKQTLTLWTHIPICCNKQTILYTKELRMENWNEYDLKIYVQNVSFLGM